jgi:NTP pyrophosphatase (non-canonical NTP hydrolase)
MQYEISKWQDDTFGPPSSNARSAARANEEMAELLAALTVDDNHPKAAEEAADIVIVLYRPMTLLGKNMNTEIERLVPAFGLPETSNARLAAHANEAMAELLAVLTIDDEHPKASDKIAGVVIILYVLAARLGKDMDEEIARKMEINRARTWKLADAGHGYHVKADASGTV